MAILKNKYLWIGVVAGLIIGDIVGVKLFKATKSVSEEAVLSGVATSTPLSLIVGGQTAGSNVFVPDVRVATTTWLAVRESNGDLLGRILGARRVPPGRTKDVMIELLRPTIPHLMYAVVMYEDDGDGAFDNKLDILIEKDGQPTTYPFAVN